MTDEIELLTRRLAREQAARREAEAILESKSLELHLAKTEAQSNARSFQQQNIQMQAILDNAGEGIITLDSNCDILSFNPAASNIFGFQQDQVIGRCFTSLLADFTKEQCLAVFKTQAERFESIEHRGIRADGSEFVLELTMSRVEDGDSSKMIAIVRDRTKRKFLEAKLAFAQKMESVGQLAAGVAHEINTPIQYVGDNTQFLSSAFDDIESVLALLDELLKQFDDKSDLAPMMATIRRVYETKDLQFLREEVPQAIQQSISGANQVAKIVRAMKEFSHPGTEKKTSFCVNQALDSTLSVSKNEWKYLTTIETDFEPDLPKCFGFPGDLNQAFLNLIVNAAQAIDERRQLDPEFQGILQIKTRSLPDWIEATIVDNGCGMSDSVREKIFDPFFTTKPVGKGTGQGLSITHSIVVEKHKGQLEVQSEPNVGTTFTIRIPRPDQTDDGNSERGQQ